MIYNILTAVLYISLAVPVSLGAYTLIHCESRKRISFIAMLASVFLYILGYLLEITANSADGGLIGVKIMHLGSAFLAPVYLLFTADYCEIKPDKKVIAILLAISLIIVTLIWTTGIHQLMYSSVEYNKASHVHYLSVQPGLLYPIIHLNAMLCPLAVIALSIFRLMAWDGKNRANLLLLLIGACVPLVFNVLFLLKIRPLGINFSPVSMVILAIAFYRNIMKHNLFDIIPRASEVALESIREAFIILDSNDNFISANDAAIKLFPSLQMTRKNSPIAKVRNWPAELQSPGKGSPFVKFVMPGNFYYTAAVSPIIARKGNLLGRIILIQDTTDSVRLTKKLEKIAFTDPLTGILNRRYFFQLAAAQIDRVKRLGNNVFIVIFDVDHFKNINDTYGHIIGDKALQCLTERVKDAIRPYDLFSRYGGEEFILLIPDITETHAVNYTERIRLSINNRPMVFENTQLTVSASFGLVSVISAGNLENAIKYSDEALYRAKNEGRNRVVLAQVPNDAPKKATA